MRKKINRKKLLEMIKLKLSDKEIAKRLNSTPETIKEIRTKEFGIKYRNPRRGMQELIIYLYKNGIRKEKTIAEILQVYPSYVSRVFSKFGLKSWYEREYPLLAKFIVAVRKGPKFGDELKALGFKDEDKYYRMAVLKGVKIKKFILAPKSKASKRKLLKINKRLTVSMLRIYYFEKDKEIAFKRILERFNVGSIRSIIRALRL